jgi:hypothetical protein
MKLVILALAVVVAVAGAASSALRAAPASSPPANPHGVLYGHVRSITQKPHRIVMQFDPAWWLTGLAGEHACGCHPLSNDYYIVDESHRLLTFAVRRDAHVTVLTQTAGPIGTASISVAELAQIVKGKNPRHRRLLEPKAGFWIQTGQKYPNAVVSLDQQYQP